MTTTLPDRLARNEAAAQNLLAQGFTTKAAQKEASSYASRAYEEARDLAMKVYLDIPNEQRTEEQAAVYFGLPQGPHQWRAKHAELIRTGLPAAAVHIPVIERLVALYQSIKAEPVNLEPRNPDGTKVRIPHRSEAYNPALREQFMAQAPALARAYERYIRTEFASILAKFGINGVIPSDLYPNERRLTDAQKNTQAVVNSVISRHASVVQTPVHGYLLDEAELARRAEKYGEEAALQWFYKTNRKLGQLGSATLHRDEGGEVLVSGEKEGCKVLLRQQVVTKWAPVKREVYHQFPARLYLDGQFMPEADYAKRFPDAEVEKD